MKALGLIMLISMLVGLCITYHRHMKAIYADIAAEDAERLAELRFEQMISGMEIHVRQQLRIVDEMGKDK